MRGINQGNVKNLRQGLPVMVCGTATDRLNEMARFLKAFGFETITVRTPEQAIEAASAHRAQVAIWLETENSARRGLMLDAARRLREAAPPVESILIGPADAPEYMEAAYRAGAYTCLGWPVDYGSLARDLEFLSLEARRRWERNLWSEDDRPFAFHGMVGASGAMRDVYGELQRVARSAAPVLICGPVGSGKELAAAATHALSSDSHRPMMIYRCCGLSEKVALAELFGDRGVLCLRGLSGAGSGDTSELSESDKSAAELLGFSRPGTLLLDEITDLPGAAQQKLAVWLVARNALSLGPAVRILATSRFDLGEWAARGKFHRSLWKQLENGLVCLPALSERVEDIPILAQHFLNRAGQEQGNQPQGFSRQAERALLQHGWPGNVRELENVITRAALLAGSERIGLEDLNLTQTAVPAAQTASSAIPSRAGEAWMHSERPVWLN